MTDVDVANLALSALGISYPITSLDDGSVNSDQLKRNLEPAIDELLSEYDWKRSLARASLPAATEEPVHGDETAFILPSDCVRLVSVETTMPYRIETLDSGSLVVLSEESAPLKITYVKRIDVTAFTANMATALAYKLAYRVAGSLSGKENMAGLMLQKYQVALGDAIGAENYESGPRFVPTFRMVRR